MRAWFLLLASCSTALPGGQMDNMRRARFEGTCTHLRSNSCDVSIEGQVFTVEGLFTDHGIGWLPSSDGMVRLTTKIADSDGWRIRCESQHQVDVGGSDRGGLYRTVDVSTRCKSEGRPPKVELFMEGWPRIDGLLIAGGKEYTIVSTIRGGRPVSLLIAERGSSLSLAIGRTEQIWIRRGLDREERKTLLRVAAAVWTAPGLRAHEGG